MNLNFTLFNFIHQFAGRNRFVDGLGIFFADAFTYVLALAAIYFIFRFPRWRQRIFAGFEIFLAELIGAGIVTEGIRHFYLHPRPFTTLAFTSLLNEAASNSFPSRHATALFALAAVIWCLDRKWGKWFFVGALLVGVARVFVGVHWPFDILGGIVIGIAAGAFVHWLVSRHWLAVETAAAEITGTNG